MKKRALFIFVIIIVLTLSACSSRGEEKTLDIISELLLLSGEDIEDSGYLYDLNASEEDIGYFSLDTRRLLYGENQDIYFSKIEDGAIFVSSRVPCEIAVFKCYSYHDRELIVRMCLERADMIKIALKSGQWEEKSQSIRILPHGKYVLFCFAENSVAVESRFKKLV